MPASSFDLAKRYWVDDISSAATAGTRLNGILEKLSIGQPLTAVSKIFLSDRGLSALARFANGEVAEAQFNQLALAEREIRMAAARTQLEMRDSQLRADQAAASAREAAMWARLDADRIKRESDPKFIAKQKNRALRHKYGVDFFVGEHHFNRLMAILRALDAGSRLPKQDAIWLRSEGSEYGSREILHTYNRIEADFCIAEYKRTGDVWMAVSASSHLRKCDASSEASELLAAILDINLKHAKLRSAVLTTRGGALRDLGQYNEALKFGQEAHALLPDNFRPCTLIGAINIEMGRIAAGHEWYRRAEERGAEPDSIVSELRSLIARMPQEKREETTAWLLRIDPSRYGWLRTKAPGRRS